MAATVDTHREVKNLVDAGFEEPQAEAVVETVVAGRAGLSTKTDIRVLRADMNVLRTEMQTDMQLLRTEMQVFRADMQTEMQLLRADMQTDMRLLRADMQTDMKDLKIDLIKWLGGTTIAVVGIAVAVLSLILGS